MDYKRAQNRPMQFHYLETKTRKTTSINKLFEITLGESFGKLPYLKVKLTPTGQAILDV